MDMAKSRGTRSFKVIDMVYCALGAVLIAICSWISIPALVPFTLQTFGVFSVSGLLGGRRGTISVLTYMLLGAIGVPVFAEFTGGIGILLGNTGGYIIGFLGSALVMWAFEKLLGKSLIVQMISMVTGMVVYFAFGTAWYMIVYAHNTGTVGIMTVLGWCVVPFIIPDIIKIALALFMVRRVGKYVQ